MKKFNFLQTRTAPKVEKKGGKFRRPGIGRIITEVQLANPMWDDNRVNTHAKILWEQRNRGTKQRGAE